MAVEHDQTDPEYWLSQITPETRELGKRANELHESAIQAIKSATPLDTETGEQGIFARFVGGGTRLTAVYRTPSGKEFSGPADS